MVIVMITVVFNLLFLCVSYKGMKNMEEESSYECGFNLMSKVRMLFSYRFFLISILFLIFDVEIVLMLSFPFLMKSEEMLVLSLLFLSVLILGLMYEYYWGTLEWINISKA